MLVCGLNYFILIYFDFFPVYVLVELIYEIPFLLNLFWGWVVGVYVPRYMACTSIMY